MLPRQPLIPRFWSKVAIGGGDLCWKWMGFLNRDGYGHLHTTGQAIVRAHRLSWTLHYGELPAGMKVLHKCDNRACVRPDHLFLGTQTDNIADMDRKGRRRPCRGEMNGGSILTAADVAEIRRLRATGTPAADVARSFSVTRVTVGDIVRRKRWKHLPTQTV